MMRPVTDINLRYLIAGNPCGGTSFIASFLTNSGYPTGHENFCPAVDGWRTSDKNEVKAEEALAESNYTIRDWRHKEPMDNISVILIVRNPFNVLNSQIADRIKKGKVVDISALMEEIVKRYTDIEEFAIFTVRVEHDLKKLCGFLGVTPTTKDCFSRHHNENRINLASEYLKNYSYYNEFKRFHDKYY